MSPMCGWSARSARTRPILGVSPPPGRQQGGPARRNWGNASPAKRLAQTSKRSPGPRYGPAVRADSSESMQISSGNGMPELVKWAEMRSEWRDVWLVG